MRFNRIAVVKLFTASFILGLVLAAIEYGAIMIIVPDPQPLLVNIMTLGLAMFGFILGLETMPDTLGIKWVQNGI